jgi:hypothetical protein
VTQYTLVLKRKYETKELIRVSQKSYHFRASVEERFRMVVAHADVVDQDSDVEVANGLLNLRNVFFVIGTE